MTTSASEKTHVRTGRLALDPSHPDLRAADFIREVRRIIGEARKDYPADRFALTEIGFLPEKDGIKVNLYFRK